MYVIIKLILTPKFLVFSGLVVLVVLVFLIHCIFCCTIFNPFYSFLLFVKNLRAFSLLRLYENTFYHCLLLFDIIYNNIALGA